MNIANQYLLIGLGFVSLIGSVYVLTWQMKQNELGRKHNKKVC